MNKCSVDIYGNTRWYEYGAPHRENGPAIIFADGEEQWWLNGKLHRLDGPAIKYPSGSKIWYKNSMIHRDDGPAIEWADGRQWFYIYGKEYTEEEYVLYHFSNGKIIHG